jgi:hypothetical protein
MFYLLLFVGLVMVACQKDELAIAEETMVEEALFTVPEIPAEIAALMTEEDRIQFEAGPGEAYLASTAVDFRNHPRAWRPRWHPVLLRLDYNLQFGPIGGDCRGEFEFCFVPGSFPNPICFNPSGEFAPVGVSGQTSATGYWRGRQPLLARYWPVFCGPDYDGYGEGYYELNEGEDVLQLVATNTPFNELENGDSFFYRYGEYVGSTSTGMFRGAVGWEISRMYTRAENNPADDPMGLGSSEVITFGWVFY